MRQTLPLLVLVTAAACRTSSLGHCGATSDCPAGTTCDPSSLVCVVPPNTCFPLCDGAHVCDPATLTCVAVQTPQVSITSPAAGASIAGNSLQATATARAPGGVTAVSFELTNAAGQRLAGGAGASSADPAAWSATLDVSAAPGGPASLTATASWSGGTVTSDPVAITIADADAPQIGNVVYTPAGFAEPASGHLIFGNGAALSVQADITDRSGIDPASVCLRAAGETGACAHPGTGGSPTWTFSLPRPAPPQDGTSAFQFTLEADDTLAAGLTGSAQAAHQARSAQTIYFQYAGPTVTVSADATPYARTAVAIPVSALVDDPSGVPDGGVFLNGTLQPASRDGGLFVFQLDPRSAPAGVEGAYTFQVSATDNIGNGAQVSGSRVIDDAPPVATGVRVFKSTDADPVTAGVTYPAAVANTGWTGSTFIYSDTVRVKGTLTDVSGVSASLHVDGIDINGAAVTGSQTPLGCTPGATTCNFDVQVQLNVAQPEFHTGTGDAGIGGALAPIGTLTLTINAQDLAASFGGAAAPHGASTASGAAVTRLLWQQAITAGNVSGLAVHASGDVIATGNSLTGDTVYDLAPDQPAIRWSLGTGGIGAVPDQPAVGAGDGTGATIYVANAIGNLYALAPDGGSVWTANTNANAFAVAPAVDNASWTDGGTTEQALEPDSDNGQRRLWAASSATPISSNQAANVDTFSSPAVLGNRVFFGNGVLSTNGQLIRVFLNANGTLSNVTAVGGLQTRPYWGPITDGTSIFAATVRGAGSTTRLDMYSIDPATLATNWDTGTGTGHLTAEPTVGIDGNLYASRYLGTGTGQSQAVTTAPPATGTFGSALVTVGTAGGPVAHVPLQGSDGHWYVPTDAGLLGAYKPTGASAVALSWLFKGPASAVSSTLDCQGRLFVASGNTVYALVTDDHGLGDTPWPSRRRDARNTGNANAPKYGIRTTGNICLQ